MSGLRSLLLGGVGGAGGVALARYFLPPDITYQEINQVYYSFFFLHSVKICRSESIKGKIKKWGFEDLDDGRWGD